MTYRNDFTLPAELLEQVQEQGLDIVPELIRIVLNAAMQAERSEHLQAVSYTGRYLISVFFYPDYRKEMGFLSLSMA